MYAIVDSGGKQYRVKEGDILKVEKLAGKVGDNISFDKILMFSDEENVNIGTPLLEDVTVNGHIVEQGKAKKIDILCFRIK